jgi:hypothetical protein
MKTITLENGETRQVSEEKYQELLALRPDFAEVVKERMPTIVAPFNVWLQKDYSWLDNDQSQEEFQIYLHMLLWKETYDKDFVPDWENSNQQQKWCLFYVDGKWITDFTYIWHQNMQVYVSTQAKAKQMLEDLKAVGVIA